MRPLSRAAFRPAVVRSRIRFRSNSAMAPKMWKTNRPPLVRVSIVSVSREHPQGFVARLHVLGDFPSVRYVNRWRTWLRKYPVNVFGYTSWPSSTPIGAAIKKLRTEQWERFAVRTSNQGLKRVGANTIHREPEGSVVAEGIVCPAQTERTECCGTCGLCWQTKRSIAFIAH
jgi:hypothetical protein